MGYVSLRLFGRSRSTASIKTCIQAVRLELSNGRELEELLHNGITPYSMQRDGLGIDADFGPHAPHEAAGVAPTPRATCRAFHGRSRGFQTMFLHLIAVLNFLTIFKTQSVCSC